jgi:hypothetical protein
MRPALYYGDMKGSDRPNDWPRMVRLVRREVRTAKRGGGGRDGQELEMPDMETMESE